MIWWNLILFAVSFVLTALLTPKPEFENARAQELDPENFPRATEDAPVPLLLGCAKIRGPNTLWYGDYAAQKITEKVKTGLFSSTKIVKGHKYYLSLDLGLCLGPDVELKKIFIDSEEVKDGTSLYPTQENNYYQNLTVDINASGGPDYQQVDDLLTQFSLTAEQFDALALAGQIKVRCKLDVSVTLTPLAGGGPADGTWWLDTQVFNATNLGGVEIFPIEGVGAVEHISSAQGGANLLVEFTMPVGARSIQWGAQISPTLSLFSIIDPNTDTDEFVIFSEGSVYEEVSSSIVEPELFGGKESGGGWVGDFTFYAGAFDQAQDADVVASIGTTDVPAYRGVSHIVLPNNYIGESPQLRKMEFLLGRYTNDLATTFGGRNQADGSDINLAEALYHIIVNGWSGLDIDTSKLNVASFQTAASTLITEGNAGSLVVSSSKQGKAIVKEILRQIDGVLAENSIGEVLLKLIRYDYTPAALTVYDEDDIIEISNFSRASWRDVVSQVKVSFPSRTKDSSKVAIAQNMATLNMLGRVKTAEVSFPFCYDPTLAATLAARELAQLSIPIINLTAVMNRSAYALTVGDVLKLTFPEFGINELICRVQRVNLGELEDNRIIVDLVQDTFAVATTVMAEPEDTGWVNNRIEPFSGVTGELVDMPYFLGQLIDLPLADGQGNVIPFPIEPQVGSTGFTMNAGTVTGELGYFQPDTVAYPVTGLMNTDYLDDAGFLTGQDDTGITLKSVLNGPPTSATSSEVLSASAGIIYVGGEWMSYEGVTDNGNGTFTLDTVNRGIFGTMPLTHLADARVYILTPELLASGDISAVLTEDGTIYYKYLDQVGDVEKDAASEAELTYTLLDIPDRPLRPRNLQLGSTRITPIIPSGSLDLTWVSSNRDETYVTFEQDADEVPDQTEQYDFEFWVDGAQDVTFDAANITSPYTVDLTTAVGSSGEIRLYSRRTGGDTKSSAYYARFPVSLASLEELSGDMSDGDDVLLTSGDEQSGADGVALSGDET